MECAVNPCLNGATCVENIGSFECLCNDGWGGLNCEQSKIIIHGEW